MEWGDVLGKRFGAAEAKAATVMGAGTVRDEAAGEVEKLRGGTAARFEDDRTGVLAALVSWPEVGTTAPMIF